MGEHDVDQQFDEKTSQAFMKALLEDLRALEYMIATGGFETGVARIGAEQEMFLVDRNMRPAPISLEVLDHAKDSRLTTEIARFNLEANLTPLSLTGRCFQQMEKELNELLSLVRKSAADLRRRRAPFRHLADAAKIRSDAGEPCRLFHATLSSTRA